MKIIINLIILFLNFKLIYSANLCEQSWECGNVPYTICANKINLIKGIAVDEESNKVLLMGKFNSSDTTYGSVSVASIPTNGGLIINEYSIKSDVTVGSGFRNTIQLFKYLPKSKLLLTQSSERLSTVVGIYSNDFHGGTLTPLWYPRGYSLAIYFDEVNQLTYTCDFNVNVYPKIIKTQDDLYGSGSAGAVILNQTRQCIGISNKFKNENLGKDNLIFASIEDGTRTNFFIGSAECPLCKRTFTSFYNYSGIANDMFIFNNNIYFSTIDSGIAKISFDNPSSSLTFITKDPTDSIYFVESQKTIYYITNSVVKKIHVETKQSSILYDSKGSKNLGTCMCADGYTGDRCNKCNGVEMWSNGNPTCVNILQYNGLPSKCQADYNCNIPYGYCNGGICSCRENFYGMKCTKCDGKIKWQNGFPICELTFKLTIF
ncbi:hypothetical protein DICPUDRAFT_35014 [Dictyostelium purpureum]|uniref:Laminin EGF-like domain-containing protein n=1 Tax=Dictyostelium purpureum TaxID=5786 RepID=F0ZNP7_DICPU|nr:uncharacterized protein DICPUDRAFT_35014 [Dictyostelium purpureum]EGC34457.1 hypothetical protein DICPUDRAFT_35014 [Dictyostelium purpureum]|eukprot:XP_003289042.1 hypothetical protein DICPUDRAFT_35014 [Dictyostelium purpureum]